MAEKQITTHSHIHHIDDTFGAIQAIARQMDHPLTVLGGPESFVQGMVETRKGVQGEITISFVPEENLLEKIIVGSVES